MIKPKFTALAVFIIFLIGLFWLRLTWHPQGQLLDVSASTNAQQLFLTGTTARITGENYLMSSVGYSQSIYAAAQDKDRPGAVVLVRDDDLLTALATTRLQHFPVNAPMLFVTNNGSTLPRETREELERLDPEGVTMDNNVKVYIIGDISGEVTDEVKGMGLKTRQIRAQNPLQLTEELDEFIAVMEAVHKRVVFIGSTEAPEYLMPGANWNAHAGNGVAFVTQDGIPPETRRLLQRRDYLYMYVFAPPDVINQNIMSELSQYGHIQRIPGETPQEIAVNWAAYFDSGRELGWWFGQNERIAGWATMKPGHNLILANPADWREVLPTGVMSHMGKHAFLLLTEEDGTLADETIAYLNLIKPTRTHPCQQVFNFAWIAGNNIPEETQRQVDELIRVEYVQTQ